MAGHAAEALAVLETKLVDASQDLTLAALALEAHLALYADKPDAAHRDAIQTYAAMLKGPIVINDTMTLTPAQIIAHGASRVLPRAADSPTGVAAVDDLYAAVPAHLQAAMLNGLMQAPLEAVRTNKREPAAEQLHLLTKTQKLPTVYRHWALLNEALLRGVEMQVESAVIALRSAPKDTKLPPNALHLLTAVLMAMQGDVAQASAVIPDMLKPWRLPFMDDAYTRKHLAAGVGGEPLPEPSVSGTTVNTSAPAMRDALHRARLSLALNLDQPAVWAAFIPVAEQASRASGDTLLFTGRGAPSAPPPASEDAYVAALFRLVEFQSAKNQPLVPLLKQLSSLELDKATAVKLEKMVQSALDSAATNRKVDDLIALSQFKPDVARNARQVVVPVLVEEIRAALRASNFERATNVANLITQTLNVDFNYDAFIVQEFEASLKDGAIVEQLNANTPDALLQPPDNATLPLGKMWDFMTEYFADSPEILDQQLKNLVAGAKGLYGAPTAMLKLMGHFNDETFPLAARQKYLASAIQQSLLGDESLSGPALADVAFRLSRIHPGVLLGPLVEQALARVTTLEDSRTLWNASPSATRQAIQAVRPQFANLMRGIDAWSTNRRSFAVGEFANITNPAYAEQIAPYLEHVRDQLIGMSGVYGVVNPSPNQHLAVIAVRSPALAGQGALSDVAVSFINALGSLTQTDTKTLATNYAAVVRSTLTLPVNFDLNNVVLNADQRAVSASGVPFDEAFGTVTRLQWGDAAGNTLTATIDGKPVTFTRLLLDTTQPMPPNGTYAVTRVFSQTTDATQLLLPAGSLLTLKTDTTPTRVRHGEVDLGEAYTVTGVLKHPAMAKVQDISGVYEPSKHTFTLDYQSPLMKGGASKATLKCQLIGPSLLCGANHSHSNRQAYGHKVLAVQTQEDAIAQARTWADQNEVTRKRWSLITPDDLLPRDTESAPEAPLETVDVPAVSGTVVISPTSEHERLLPEPVFAASPSVVKP